MKILTFDCYGTLLNTDSLYEYIFNLASKHNLDGKEAKNIFINYEDRLMYGEEYIKYDELIRQVLDYCDLEMNTDIFKDEYSNIIEIHKGFKPFPDVIENLEYLKEEGYKLYLMSNSIHSIVDYHLKEMNNVFDEVFLAEDTHCYKPNLKFFKFVEESLNLDKSEHCHIAKGYFWDIVPCSKLGWNKIWVNRKNQKGMSLHKPYVEIRTLDELKKIF